MSLVIVGITADAIVFGADSAMTERQNGSTVIVTGFPKIIQRLNAQQMVAFVGEATVGPPEHATWVSHWMRTFLNEVVETTDAEPTAQEMAEALNRECLPYDKHIKVILAAWEGTEHAHAVAFLVAPNDANDSYEATRLLSEDQSRTLAGLRGGAPESQDLYLFSVGVPEGYVSWLNHDGLRVFSGFVDASRPFDTVAGVEEYIRFGIRTAAGLYRISGQAPVVSEPISTGILFAEPKNMVVRRN